LDIGPQKLENATNIVFSFTDSGGFKLFAQAWHPKTSPKAVLIYVHGIGDHSGRIADMAIELASKASISVYSYDQIAHGRSEGEGHEYFSQFSFLPTDLVTFVELIKKENSEKGIPHFIYGHSLGGLVVANYLQDISAQKFFCGVFLHAAAVAPTPQAENNPALITVGEAISKVAPRAAVEKLSLDTLARDPLVVEKYREDPLVWHQLLKARTGIELYEATAHAKDLPENISIPLVYIQGTGDTVVNEPKAQPWFQNISSKDKTFHKFIGGFHENHRDYEKKLVYKIVEDWVYKKIEKPVEEGCQVIDTDVSNITGDNC